MGNINVCTEDIKVENNLKIDFIIEQKTNFSIIFTDDETQLKLVFNKSMLYVAIEKSTNKQQYVKRQNKDILNPPLEAQSLSYSGLFNVIQYYEDKVQYQQISDQFQTIKLSSQIQNNYHMKLHSITGIIYQIANIVQFFHNHNMMIRNLSLQSFIINPETHHIQFVDYEGVCKSKSCSKIVNASILYSSPEQIQGNYDSKTDIWSLGVCIAQVLIQEYPFRCVNKQLDDSSKMRVYISKLVTDDIYLRNIPKEYINILKDCLNLNSKLRPDIYQIFDQFIFVDQKNTLIKSQFKEYTNSIVSTFSETFQWKLLGYLFQLYDKYKLMELQNYLLINLPNLNQNSFIEILIENKLIIRDHQEIQYNIFKDIDYILDNNEINFKTISIAFFIFDKNKESQIASFVTQMKYRYLDTSVKDLLDYFELNLDNSIKQKIIKQIKVIFNSTKIDLLEMVISMMNYYELEDIYNLKWFNEWYINLNNIEKYNEFQKNEIFRIHNIKLMKQSLNNLDKLIFIYRIQNEYPSPRFEKQFIKQLVKFSFQNQINLKNESKYENLKNQNFTKVKIKKKSSDFTWQNLEQEIDEIKNKQSDNNDNDSRQKFLDTSPTPNRRNSFNDVIQLNESRIEFNKSKNNDNNNKDNNLNKRRMSKLQIKTADEYHNFADYKPISSFSFLQFNQKYDNNK